MSDKEFVIELEDDTEGHGLGKNIVEPEDADWLEDRLRRDGGKTNIRITLSDEDDTEGHDAGPTTLRLNVADDDDTEGHAIAIHFPSRAEADAFRRRLLVTGVLVGTVALGAAGGVGLSALQSDAGSAGSASTAVTQTGPMDPTVIQSGQDWEAQREQQSFSGSAVIQSGQDWEAQREQQSGGQAAAAPVDADRDIGIMDASGAAAGTGTQTGPMDAHEAPAFQNAGLSDADQAYADRLSGQAAAAQTGPMDVHEAPAFQNAGLSDADQAYADRLSGQAAASQTGPTDAHELRRQVPAAQTGPMDAHEAPAFQQSSATSVDADSDIGIMDASGAAAGTDAEGAPGYVDAARNQALQNQAGDDDATPDLKGRAPR